MKNKSVYIVLALILIGLMIFSFKRSPSTKQIKIGVIAPLSGPVAEIGEAFRNGIKLAQIDAPGSNALFIYEDNRYDPKFALSAYRKLVDVDKVDLVMNWSDATSQVVAPLATRDRIPLIAFSSDGTLTRSDPFIVRTLYKTGDVAHALWSYFRTKGYKKIGLIKFESLYFNEVANDLKVSARPDESVTLVDNRLDISDKDFRDSILKAKQGGYDAIGLFLFSEHVEAFYKQANALGLKAPTFGTDTFETEALRETFPIMEGAVYVTFGTSQEFSQRYRSAYGNEGQIGFAGNGYDVAMMVLNEFDHSSSDKLIGSIEKIKDYKGVTGSYSFFSKEGDRFLHVPVVVRVIKSGQIYNL